MVIASHIIFTAYDFWLPNDPRGSWSDFVGAWQLARFGRATKTDERRSVAWDAHDNQLRIAAKQALKYSPVEFSGHQALAIARAFEAAASEKEYQFLALSILPRHVHAVVGRHERGAEDIIGHLKFAATQMLVGTGMHPFFHMRNAAGRLPTVWTKRGWKVFLDSEARCGTGGEVCGGESG